MIGRRMILKGLGLMTIPGAGGQTPPRPDQQYPGSSGAVIAPGSTAIVRAREVIISGPGGLLLVYSPSAGFGNLIYSVAGASGTDPYGNVYLEGAVSYRNAGGGTYWALQTLGVTETWFVSTAGAGGPYTQFADIGFGFSTPPNLASLLIQANNQVSFGNSGAMVWNDTGSATPSQLTLPAGGGPFVTSETWHNISLAGNFSGTFRVMLTPWNTVRVNGALTWSGTGPTTATFGSVPSSAYNPQNDVRHPVGFTGVPTSVQAAPRVFVPAAGTGLQLILPSVTAGGSSIGFDFEYPTN